MNKNLLKYASELVSNGASESSRTFARQEKQGTTRAKGQIQAHRIVTVLFDLSV